MADEQRVDWAAVDAMVHADGSPNIAAIRENARLLTNNTAHNDRGLLLAYVDKLEKERDIARAESVTRSKLADVERLHRDNARLRDALERSVGLQSHYARLLNGYLPAAWNPLDDGVVRMQFVSADAWLARLAELDKTSRASP